MPLHAHQLGELDMKSFSLSITKRLSPNGRAILLTTSSSESINIHTFFIALPQLEEDGQDNVSNDEQKEAPDDVQYHLCDDMWNDVSDNVADEFASFLVLTDIHILVHYHQEQQIYRQTHSGDNCGHIDAHLRTGNHKTLKMWKGLINGSRKYQIHFPRASW